MCGRQIMAMANSMRSAFRSKQQRYASSVRWAQEIVCTVEIVAYFYITFAARVQHTIQAID